MWDESTCMWGGFTLWVWLVLSTGSLTFICIVCFGYHIFFLEECSVSEISQGPSLLMIWNFVFLSHGSSSILCLNRTDRLVPQVREMRLTLYYFSVSFHVTWPRVIVQQRKWSACTRCSSPAQCHIAVALQLTHNEFTGCKLVFLTYK